MGHYASEMGYESEKELQQRVERKRRLAEAIRREIDQKGLEYVLAEILESPTSFRIRLG